MPLGGNDPRERSFGAIRHSGEAERLKTTDLIRRQHFRVGVDEA